jgi:hypothetical protein
MVPVVVALGEKGVEVAVMDLGLGLWVQRPWPREVMGM